MVGEEHFGGFMTRKPDELGEDGKPKTWKERMEEIIAKSKKEKVTWQMWLTLLENMKHISQELWCRYIYLRWAS